MPNFRRKRDEAASVWAARLSREDASALTSEQLDDLTLRRIQAERAVKRTNPPRHEPEQSDAPPVSPESEGLRRCKDAVRALSPNDLRQLVQWIKDGMIDGRPLK